MSKITWIGFITMLLLAGCNQAPDELPQNSEEALGMLTENPFYSRSTLDFQYPHFDKIKSEHYLPAFQRGMAEQLVEIEEITSQSAEPSFANTIIPLELSGELLSRVASVFFALSSAHTNEDIQAIEVEVSPKLSAHRDSINLNRALFERVKTVYNSREKAGLDIESLRLLENYYRDFVLSGAQLDDSQQERLRAINAELAKLETQFDQNVLAEVNASAIVVENLEELSGLSDAEVQTAADRAEERGISGKYVIPLLNTSGQPILPSLENRSLRQRITEASLSRGSRGNEFDNTLILAQVARLRAERAQLLGYANHASLRLVTQTAQTVEAVETRLASLIPPAIANAEREAAELQDMLQQEGADFTLASWDWAFYTEKVRQEKFAFDEAQLRPYFEINNVLQKGVFFAANQIYGLSFDERFDLPVYQEDVRVFDVKEEDGSQLAIFIFDPYARPSKRGGAWMNSYVDQSELTGNKAIVANHLNIPEPPEGQPTLLTFDEVTTMFHEFGHALHGMFSNVIYPSFSGTSVPRDFVEFPSQVNEMWASWPEVLKNYAVHFETNEPMPSELLDKVLATQKFNQGFATSEYLMAALIDMKLHVLAPEDVPTGEELMQYEERVLNEAGANLAALPPRYRYPYFSHIIGGYSAGYYAYIWSEVLDADTVNWFKENGGMLRDNGQHFRESLLSRGGSVDAMQLFRDFRGRDASVEPLLERRGLN
jgi:peptidyl-dipeptidase Dcp